MRKQSSKKVAVLSDLNEGVIVYVDGGWFLLEGYLATQVRTELSNLRLREQSEAIKK